MLKEKQVPEGQNRKKCFIITPLGSSNSETRIKADGLINAVLQPVLEALDYDMISPHKIDAPGSITNQVINYLLESDMVVANLTGLNPNVMYELAIRHASRLPVVCVLEEGTTLPFDIAVDRVIFYHDAFAFVEDLKKRLHSSIVAASKEEIDNIDNPIYRAAKYGKILRDVKINDKDSIIFERLEEISKTVQLLTMSNQRIFPDRLPVHRNYINKMVSYTLVMTLSAPLLDTEIKSIFHYHGLIPKTIDLSEDNLMATVVFFAPLSFDKDVIVRFLHSKYDIIVKEISTNFNEV